MTNRYTQESDEFLLSHAVEESECFSLLIERYEQKLKYYIFRISHFSHLEAEEILQDVFLKVWVHMNDFDADMKFSTWIYRITHNEVISRFRKSKTRGEQNRSEFNDEVLYAIESDIDIVEAVDADLRAKVVHDVLDHIKPEYKNVLVLYYFENKKYDEISDILEKSVGTVSTLIHRAKKEFISYYTQKYSSLSLIHE